MTFPQFLPEALQDKLLDPDEKIRAAVCRLYSQLDYETALHHVSTLQLKGVASRGIDRRVRLLVIFAFNNRLTVIQPLVQVEAMKAIGRLYSLAYTEM